MGDKMLKHDIKIRDNGLDYYVLIDGDVYEMNKQANQPNGVCIYIGKLEGKLKKDIQLESDIIDLKDVPEGIKKQINYLITR